MVKPWVKVIAFTWLQMAGAAGAAYAAARADLDTYPAWRAAAARTLAARRDSASLATAAALTFIGPPSRSRAESAKAAAAALELAVEASELAPDNPAISWLHLQLCTYAPGCDVRDAATTMRWIAADNGAAWLPTLATAQRDKDTVEIDRVLASMAEGAHFDLYANRATVMMFDALKSARSHLPKNYLTSDLARLTEAKGIADATLLPSFSPLINVCREAAGSDPREDCLTLSKTMQRADAVMAQLVGFAIEKRLTPTDARELRTIADRRRLLEWRVAAADQSDEPVLPWIKNARARWYLAKMRALPREEDVCIAWLREHKMPLEPPEDHR
jgi:hypothetical protein